MDKKQALKITQGYLKQVVKKYPVENALLFGSFAKGTNHKDSDIDLAIIFNSLDDVIEMQINLLKMRTNTELLIEPHPFQMDDFTSANPIAAEIIKNGIKVEGFMV